MMSDYQPIDCGLYSEYELAIVQRKRLRISWREPDGQLHIERLQPCDLQTRDHAEFLIVLDRDAIRRELRLDRIVTAEPV